MQIPWDNPSEFCWNWASAHSNYFCGSGPIRTIFSLKIEPIVWAVYFGPEVLTVWALISPNIHTLWDWNLLVLIRRCTCPIKLHEKTCFCYNLIKEVILYEWWRRVLHTRRQPVPRRGQLQLRILVGPTCHLRLPIALWLRLVGLDLSFLCEVCISECTEFVICVSLDEVMSSQLAT